MSISVTVSPFNTTVSFCPMAETVIRFHSPGFFTALFFGAKCPKTAAHCHVLATALHCLE